MVKLCEKVLIETEKIETNDNKKTSFSFFFNEKNDRIKFLLNKISSKKFERCLKKIAQAFFYFYFSSLGHLFLQKDFEILIIFCRKFCIIMKNFVDVRRFYFFFRF